MSYKYCIMSSLPKIASPSITICLTAFTLIYLLPPLSLWSILNCCLCPWVFACLSYFFVAFSLISYIGVKSYGSRLFLSDLFCLNSFFPTSFYSFDFYLLAKSSGTVYLLPEGRESPGEKNQPSFWPLKFQKPRSSWRNRKSKYKSIDHSIALCKFRWTESGTWYQLRARHYSPD